MRSILICILSFVLIIISSCGDDIQNGNTIEYENNFRYPVSLNSFWYYTTKNVTTNIRPDSIKHLFNLDTIRGYGISNFIKDTVIGFDSLKVLKNEYTMSGHNAVTQEYYLQTDTGLIRKAFMSSSSGMGPYRNKYRFVFNDQIYNSLLEISASIRNGNDFINNEVIIDNPPVKVISYPLEKNNEWLMFANDFVSILKKYTGYEIMNISGKDFYCMKISRKYFHNTIQSDIISNDYFSKEGIVRRELLIRNIQITNELGNLIGFIDLSEITNVNLFSIP